VAAAAGFPATGEAGTDYLAGETKMINNMFM
jgi:hypothetical protein